LIPHSRPLLEDDVVRAAQAVTATGYLAQGPWVERFEREIAGYLRDGGRCSAGGSPRTWEGVAVNSGTMGLLLCLLGVGVGPGDEVIVPSYVCTAVMNAVRQAGAVPVVADVEEGGYNLCPRAARQRLTARTRALLVPHMFGIPADLEALLALGPPVIEDCAQAIGAQYGGRPVGSYGVATALSFYATKVLTTGEGGMALAATPRIVERMRDLREYDQRSDHRQRYSCKMTDLQAALGVSQWARLPGFIERRNRIARMYDAGLGLGRSQQRPCGVTRPRVPDGTICYRYLLRLPESYRAERETERIVRELQAAKVDARRPVFRPLHRFTGDACPNADAAYRTTFSLPLYPALTDKEVGVVIQVTRRVLDGTHRTL
jgi:dTDP-4-amino-4,6-dideoxygalactose transaminase